VNAARTPIQRRTAQRLGLHLTWSSGILLLPELTEDQVAEFAQKIQGASPWIFIVDECSQFFQTGRLRPSPARRGGVRSRRHGRIRR
jgi:hypothetical protein